MTDQPTPPALEPDVLPPPEPTAQEIAAALPFLVRLVQIGHDVDARLEKERKDAAETEQAA